ARDPARRGHAERDLHGGGAQAREVDARLNERSVRDSPPIGEERQEQVKRGGLRGGRAGGGGAGVGGAARGRRCGIGAVPEPPGGHLTRGSEEAPDGIRSVVVESAARLEED